MPKARQGARGDEDAWLFDGKVSDSERLAAVEHTLGTAMLKLDTIIDRLDSLSVGGGGGGGGGGAPTPSAPPPRRGGPALPVAKSPGLDGPASPEVRAKFEREQLEAMNAQDEDTYSLGSSLVRCQKPRSARQPQPKPPDPSPYPLSAPRSTACYTGGGSRAGHQEAARDC